MYQMTRLTADRGSLANDDRLDALSMAVAFWVSQVAQDTERQMATRKEELLNMEVNSMKDKGKLGLAVFSDSSFRSANSNSWI
jgi:hypothetical protein